MGNFRFVNTAAFNAKKPNILLLFQNINVKELQQNKTSKQSKQRNFPVYSSVTSTPFPGRFQTF